MWSYEGIQMEVNSDPLAWAASPANEVARQVLWDGLNLTPGVTVLGFGAVTLLGEEVPGFYFQGSKGTAKKIAITLGLDVYQLGDLLFFSPENRPEGVLMPDKQLLEQVTKLAFENPELRADLMPLLIEETYPKQAFGPDTEKFVEWALVRNKRTDEQTLLSFFKNVLGMEPVQPEALPPRRTGALTPGESVICKKDKNSNEHNVEACEKFDRLYGVVEAASREGVTVKFSNGQTELFRGTAAGAKTGLYREEPKGDVYDRVQTPKSGIEMIYVSGGQHVPDARDDEALERYIEKGLERGESRSDVYYSGIVTKLAYSKKDGSLYFTMMVQQRARPFTSISPGTGKILYIGKAGNKGRPGGWESEAARMGIFDKKE